MSDSPLRGVDVIVGMSGGVDSSVSAFLLKQEGLSIGGLFMRNWEDNDPDNPCTAAEDAMDAHAVCEKLDIPFDAINFAQQYWDEVFSDFLDEYRRGRTPNPDVFCNQEIKFSAFLDYCLSLGAKGIATGHYASRDECSDGYLLCRGIDRNKDQSYFLYRLNQQQLEKAQFPLGELTKPQVRALAEQQGFANHAKKDSTGICFIGERNFKEFLSRYIDLNPGNIVTAEGTVVGEHQGLPFYTIGQRQGLGIGGRRDAGGEPYFVVDKDHGENELIVAQGHDHPRLFKRQLTADKLNWISGSAPQIAQLQAKIRYRQDDQPCQITMLEENRCHVVFDTPQRAVTPGQSVVFYDGRVCLGGGIIE